MQRLTLPLTCLIGSLLAAVAFLATPVCAQGLFEDIYPGFFTLQSPPTFNLTGFGGGFISDKYGTLQQGLQFEQSVTPYLGAVGRITGYQLWEGQGFDNPLNPGTGHQARLNFARFQGGADFILYPGTHLFVLGGRDAGDSHASTIEGDFSSWLFLHSMHPINFSFSVNSNYENHVISSSVDLQVIVKSTRRWIFLAGGGGAYYTGGFIPGLEGQGGPDLGVYYRPWTMGVSTQAGYGAAHQYGQISIYKQLTIFE